MAARRGTFMRADAEIVGAVLRGDREAFAALVSRYERAVWATAWRVLRDDHAAADAAQEAFLELLIVGVGGAGGLLGVAADAKGAPNTLRRLSYFSQETVSDADFAAAVRRGLDDLRELDEVRDVQAGGMLPPGAGEHSH
jgi:hypothetical protein